MRSIRSTLRGIALTLVVLANAGCYGYRPVETAPAPGSRVRIVLTNATDVQSIAPPGSPLTHPGVLEVSGTIVASSTDTVAVRLGELRTATGSFPGVGGRTALLPVARIGRVEARRFQAANTALAGVGVATIAVGAFLIVLIVTLTTGF
jgi:hypothetical protein